MAVAVAVAVKKKGRAARSAVTGNGKCQKLIEIPCELFSQIKALAKVNGRPANQEIERAIGSHVRKYLEKIQP